VIQIPVYLAVAQWVILLSLGLLLVILYRQLSRHLGIGPRPSQGGLAVGSPAEGFTYEPLNRHDGLGRFEPASGRPSLLMFADPSCVGCETALRALSDEVQPVELEGLEVLVVTTEPAAYVAASPTFEAAAVPLGRITSAIADRYRVVATPTAYAIAADGTVRAEGHPTSAGELRTLVAAAAAGGSTRELVAHGPGRDR
jgi:hypothetical protein